MTAATYDDWAMHKVYVCNLATNGSCRTFLERAVQKNPDLAFLHAVIEQYARLAILWQGADKGVKYPGDCLESLGGGFNATLSALQDTDKRSAIAGVIRACAACMDRVIVLLQDHLPTA